MSSLINTYTTLYPQASKPRNIVDLSIKLKSKKNSSSTINSKTLAVDTLLLMEKCSSVTKKLGLEFHGLSIDKNSAELLVRGNSIENLNIFKENIEKEMPNLTINLDSVNSIDNKYQGKLRIK